MKFVNNKQYRPYALKSSRRHVGGGGGVQAIALYALVICDWHISDKRLCVILLTPKGGRHEIMTSYA